MQAVQYWLKLTAIAVPACVMLAFWGLQGAPPSQAPPGWAVPSSDPADLYGTYSLLLALLLGTMGLPHVLTRFYTNPDGTDARRTTRTVIGLLGLFYVWPPVYAVLAWRLAPELDVVMLVDKDPDTAAATVIVADINKGNKQIAHGIDAVLRPADL